MRLVQNKCARLQVHSTVVVRRTVFAGCFGRPAWRRVVRRQYLFVEASIELRQLRYFVAVAEALHFGRAAERLHMSQSPLSRAIRDLERELGLVLFVRTTRRVELTAAGSVLLERSRQALIEIDGAIADARRAVGPDSGVLGIGYGPFKRGGRDADRGGGGGQRCQVHSAPGGGGDAGLAPAVGGP